MKEAAINNPHLREIHDMGTTLAADYEFCQQHLTDENQNDFWKRSLARCACALVEGIASVMRKFVLESASHGGIQHPHLIAALREETYWVDADGDLKVQRKPIPTFNALAFVFRTYAAVFHSPFKLNKSDEGWAALKIAFDVRNRVMHPKELSDLVVSDEEVQRIQSGFAYFWNCLMFLYDSSRLFSAGDSARRD